MTKTEANKITYRPDGQAQSFTGPQAVEVFRAATLASAIGLWKIGVSPGPGVMNAAECLKEATKYTGKKYGRKDFDQARADLRIWINEQKKTIPSETAAQ